MNLDRPEFRDKEVRKALGLALNREGMARSIMRDPTVAAPQVFAPSMPGWHVAASEPFRQDQAAARRALDAAGWAVGADGVRTKDGRRLAFELISYTSRPEIPVAATVVQADLKAVGVDVAIRSAEWTIVPEAQKDGSLQAALMSRGYSLVADPTPSVSRVGAGGRMRIASAVIPRTHILMPNCAKPQFADARTRRALSLAIDRAGIAASIMRNPGLTATHYLAPMLSEWHFADVDPLRQDVAAARRVLDEAGWVPGPDGVRAKDGVRFAGTFRTFVNRPELPVIASALQSQFKAIGFDLAISVGEFQAITEGQRDGTLDLGLSSRNTTIVPDPVSTITLDFTSDVPAPGATGATNWRNDDIRRSVAGYLGAAEEAMRPPIRRRIVEILQQELPVILIVWYDQIVAVGSRVDGFVVDPFEHRVRLERLTARS